MTTATAPQPTGPALPQHPRVPYEGLFVAPAYADGLPYERDEDEDDGE
ncbi:hypothetical protein [Streptomyces scabiei]|nr:MULTISPECIES: hypothetical protein [Streptomyces]MDX2800164.1 hypothetical protein [Streptomyces scabiei]MDX3125845.1 hypothetical protein [Streptomyces scabiei]MDX3283656.1 hypothetical protein [Streptomyces scabiei]